MEELKGHLEAVAAYAAITNGVELLEQKRAGGHISLAKKIVWPTLQDAPNTNNLVLEYLEDNESLMSKLRELTTDSVKSDEQTDVELYMKHLEAALEQKEEPEEDKVPDNDEEMAEMALQSYEYDPNTGVSKFVMPRGVTDVQLMRALNVYFRKHLGFKRDAIFDDDVAWFEECPEKYPEYCKIRENSGPSSKLSRTITITALVSGTTNKSRDDQEKVLKAAGLSFSDPRDIALAVALHACKNNGEDLLKGNWVRSSVPGVALFPSLFSGVVVKGFNDVNDFNGVAASGSPSPELKN